MTDAEHHQQELERQELEEIKTRLNKNHGKLVGAASVIRDGNEDVVRIGIKYLLEALKEYEELTGRTV